MQIEVHIRNGRTVFRFPNRSAFRQVLQAEPDHEGKRVLALVKHNIDDTVWQNTSVRQIGKNSISFVLEVPRDEPVVPEEP